MPDQEKTDGEHRLLSLKDLEDFVASLPKCAQCQEHPRSNLHIGFYDPFKEGDIPRSTGYYREHLCLQCYLSLLHANLCAPQEPAAE